MWITRVFFMHKPQNNELSTKTDVPVNNLVEKSKTSVFPCQTANFSEKANMKRNKNLFGTGVKAAVVVLVLCVVLFSGCGAKTANAEPPFVVVVDAGHGGVDGGVSGISTKVKESELNLSVAKKLQTALQKEGFIVVMTRTTSDGLYDSVKKGFKREDMERRRQIAAEAKPDLLLSVHMNAFPGRSRRGGQVFYSAQSGEGKRLAECIQGELNELSDRRYAPLAGDYFMLECVSAPSCIVECGFLSNAEEEKLLISDEYQQKLAESIFSGVKRFLSAVL